MNLMLNITIILSKTRTERKTNPISSPSRHIPSATKTVSHARERNERESAKRGAGTSRVSASLLRDVCDFHAVVNMSRRGNIRRAVRAHAVLGQPGPTRNLRAHQSAFEKVNVPPIATLNLWRKVQVRSVTGEIFEDKGFYDCRISAFRVRAVRTQ